MSGIISIRLPYVKGRGTWAWQTKEAIMLMSFIQAVRQQYQLKQTIVGLQRRADDRLLEDIGLTRDDLNTLLQTPQKPGLAARVGIVMQWA
jgi:uncharacterized protein YjiS (DUF1127 family)